MKTEFLPEPWLDETIPERGDHPDVFLHSSDGQWYFRPVEDGEDRDQPEYWTALTPGQVVLFCEFRNYDQWTIAITSDDDGRPIWSGGEAIDPEANCFYCDDDNDDAFGDTLQELVATMAANVPGIEGEFSVWAYHCSEGRAWIFEIVDGRGRFRRRELAS